ncbi:MAG: outer membrane beta-barrel protein [Crocinitomicaceae bacterium]|nr:outer membrane beta-barrel protein [Crocinitomicaceae bacterium]
MKSIYQLAICLLFFNPNNSLFAQVTNTATLDTTGGQQIGNTSIGAYLDAYFGYDFNEPAGKDVPLFVSSARHNEFNINLAFIDFRYNSENFRARVVPAFGTYMNSNYASEPGTLRNLLEANTGFRISKKKNIWIDAGILGSPYTNESAISKDHLMYTRSLAPEYVPYYLCGIKTSFPLGKKTEFLFLHLKRMAANQRSEQRKIYRYAIGMEAKQ